MNAIVSVTNNWAIGKDNDLLISNKDDMRRFVALTKGATVVMGRKTFESLPGGPLKGRRNICLTRNMNYKPAGVEVVHSVSEILEHIAPLDPDTVWLIGGEALYRLLLNECSRVYVTKHACTVEADAYFPNLDKDSAWSIESMEAGGVTEQGVEFSYITYVKEAR